MPNGSKFNYSVAGHVIAGNLKITSDSRIRHIITKAPGAIFIKQLKSKIKLKYLLNSKIFLRFLLKIKKFSSRIYKLTLHLRYDLTLRLVGSCLKFLKYCLENS